MRCHVRFLWDSPTRYRGTMAGICRVYWGKLPTMPHTIYSCIWCYNPTPNNVGNPHAFPKSFPSIYSGNNMGVFYRKLLFPSINAPFARHGPTIVDRRPAYLNPWMLPRKFLFGLGRIISNFLRGLTLSFWVNWALLGNTCNPVPLRFSINFLDCYVLILIEIQSHLKKYSWSTKSLHLREHLDLCLYCCFF